MQKKDKWALGLIILSLVVVFYDVLVMKWSFLAGDHIAQQFPWADFLQKQIRQFRLPWWTAQMHAGFPLLAEGQVGAFYLPNLIFLFLFPIKFAYSYEILFHYALGASLFYWLLRRNKISALASIFGTLIYLYGSSQGGYFYYNLISQRVVIWLPLSLILIDHLFKRGGVHYAFYLSFVFALEIFGGYLQVAVYTLLYSTCYFVFCWTKDRSVRPLLLYLGACFLGVGLSLCQLLPTYELSLLSSRAVATKQIAYLGSMKPIGFLTLYYPYWDGFLGSEAYIGIISLFFLFLSFFIKKDQPAKFHVIAAGLFFLLALGKFSPLYVGIVELTHFYAFRTPIKFLFFVVFSCAYLAAYGFDWFFSEKRKMFFSAVNRAKKLYFIISVIMIALPIILQSSLTKLESLLRPILVDYVKTHIFGHPGHLRSLEHYAQQASGFYHFVIESVSLATWRTLISWVVIVATVVFLKLVLDDEKKWWRRSLRFACCGLLFIDLFVYGRFMSIRAALRPFESIDFSGTGSQVVRMIKKDASIYRTMEVYQEPSDAEKFPLYPNFNMLYGIDNLGAYSPLAVAEYKRFLAGWGFVNDSISIDWMNRALVLEKLKDLSFLNVKYILSPTELKHKYLKLLLRERDVFLYRNKQVVSRAFFLEGRTALESLEEIQKPTDVISVKFLRYEQDYVEIEFTPKKAGLLVLSDLFYPNWIARANGKQVEIKKVAKLFRGILLNPGDQKITFQYSPLRYRYCWYMTVFLTLGSITTLTMKKFAAKRK